MNKVHHSQIKPGQRVRYHSIMGDAGEICTVCSKPWLIGHVTGCFTERKVRWGRC